MMSTLHTDWFLTPAFDLELKEYASLGYLQAVNGRFQEMKLYPYLTDLREHLGSLQDMKDRHELMQRLVMNEVEGVDLEAMRLRFKKAALPEQEILELIEQVIEQAMPRFQHQLEIGLAIQEEFRDRIQFGPVGVLPLNASTGYLMLKYWHETRVYSYSLGVLREHRSDLQYRNLHTRFVTTYTEAIDQQPEMIRGELIRHHSETPHPATFLFETDLSLPHIETFIPIAKQLTYRHITSTTV